MVFNKASKTDAKIIHEGMITAKQAGLVGLVAPSVENSDIITSKVGKVKLASGDSFTIDINTGSTEEWLRINAPIT